MNIYYDPEKFGLTIIAEIDDGTSYDFDQTVVFQDKAGVLYSASDSGCSCPTPFDNIGLEDLEKIDFESFEKSVLDKTYYQLTPLDIKNFLSAVKDALLN